MNELISPNLGTPAPPSVMAAAPNKGHSLRKAINAKCKDCCYDPADKGTWRQQVTACRVMSCPLHRVRPQSTVKRKVTLPPAERLRESAYHAAEQE